MTNQNVVPTSSGGGSQPQGINPYNYPANYYPQQLPQQGQQPGGQPIQQVQPVVTGASPEVPAKREKGEYYIPPGVFPQIEKGQEQKEKVERKPREEGVSKEVADVVPEQKKFESPFKVYGYRASQQVSALGQKTSSQKVKGDVSFAKTWLIVLLGRLLRLHTGGVLQAS